MTYNVGPLAGTKTDTRMNSYSANERTTMKMPPLRFDSFEEPRLALIAKSRSLA